MWTAFAYNKIISRDSYRKSSSFKEGLSTVSEIIISPQLHMYLLPVGIPDVQAEIDTFIGTGDEQGGIIWAASIVAVEGGSVGQIPGLIIE